MGFQDYHQYEREVERKTCSSCLDKEEDREIAAYHLKRAIDMLFCPSSGINASQLYDDLEEALAYLGHSMDYEHMPPIVKLNKDLQVHQVTTA